jgi:hypothetical protein
MLKIFYVGGSAATAGILRAVLLDARQVAQLAASQELAYLGSHFPRLAKGHAPATIIEVLGEQPEMGLRSGFYRAQQAPFQFEDTLRATELDSAPLLVQLIHTSSKGT